MDPLVLRRYSAKKLLLCFAMLIIASLLIIAGYFFIRERSIAQEKEAALDELHSVLKEIDEQEPEGWDFEALERQRPAVPMESNGAEVILEVLNALPAGWDPGQVLALFNLSPLGILNLNPSFRLDEENARNIKEELNKIQPALGKARKLLDCPTGRFPSMPVAPDFFFRASTHRHDQVKKVIDLLEYETVSLCHDKAESSAWLSALAMIHAGRALGDEPAPLAQMLRLTNYDNVLKLLERILAQGEVDDSLLEKTNLILEQEFTCDAVKVWLQVERAGQHLFYSNLAAGKLDLDLKKIVVNLRGEWSEDYENHDRFLAMVYRSHAFVLRYLTKALMCARRDTARKKQCIQDLDEKIKDGKAKDLVPTLASVLTPSLRAVFFEYRRRTQIECAHAAIAAERFRLREKRWPKAVDEIIHAGLLKEPPFDYDLGQPLRFRHSPDGVVFYSPSFTDYKGDYLDQPDPDPISLGEFPPEFRLWSPDYRARPPRFEKKSVD